MTSLTMAIEPPRRRVRVARRVAPTAPAMIVRNMVISTCTVVGVSERQLLEGLALDPKLLRVPFGRVPWDQTNELYARIGALTTREQRRAIGSAHTTTLPQLRAVAQLTLSPRLLLDVAVVGTRRLWPDVPLELRELSDRRIEVRASYPVGARLEPAIDDATTAFWETLPTLLGLPPAGVEEAFDEVSATWRIRLPRAPALAARVRSRVQPAAEALISELAILSGDLSRLLGPAPRVASECEVLALQRQLGLTRAEARVAWRIAHGATPREIARELGVSLETVRTHLKRTYSKAGVRRQAELVQAVLTAVR